MPLDLRNPPISYGHFSPKNDPSIIEYAKIYNSKIVVYPSFELFQTNRGYSDKSQENLLKGLESGSSGYIQNKGKRKIDQYINTWITSVVHYMRSIKEPKHFRYKYLNFVTLTLASKQVHTDNEIKSKCFNDFIKQLNKKACVKTYLWVAERQGNGNIHFHVLIDKPIEWQKIRAWWNKSQNILKYVDNSVSDNPNSTDIHSLKSIENPSAYITKYMSKNDISGNVKYMHYSDMSELMKLAPVDGRVWGSSKNLSKIQPFTDYSYSYYKDLKKIVLSNTGNTYKADYFCLYDTWKYEKKTVENFISTENFKKIQDYYCELFKVLYN